METVVTDTLLLTFDPTVPGASGALGIVDQGAVGWDDGEITYVGPAADLKVPAGTRTVDGHGCLTLPGLVNAHVHGRQSIIRGAAQDVPEAEWMHRALGPIDSHVTPEDGVIGARLTAIEALSSGVTTLGEYATNVGELVEHVYRPLGLRVVATELISEVTAGEPAQPDAPDQSTAAHQSAEANSSAVPNDSGTPAESLPLDFGAGEAALGRAEDLFGRFDADPLVTPAYGPQALDMVSLDLLAEIVDRARRDDRTVHMHVAQGEREQATIEARFGSDATTVGVLKREGLLGDHLLAAHLHGATPTERAHLAESGVRMVACPSSIAAIDGAVPPMTTYLEQGGVVGIGTDQAPGPGGHNALREVRTAALLAKVDASDPTAIDAAGALELATIGGARALGIEDRVGSLSVGKRADVVVCDMTRPSVSPTVSTPFTTAIPNLVYGTAGDEVRDVFVDGVQLVSAGGIVGVDVDNVVAEAVTRAERIFAAAAVDWRAAGSALVDAVDQGRL